MRRSAANGSDLRIDAIQGATISVVVSGGAEVEIAGGTCKSLLAVASAGSSLNMNDASCIKADIGAETGSTVSVQTQSIFADVTSGAWLRVYGADTAKNISVSGGGEIEFR